MKGEPVHLTEPAGVALRLAGTVILGILVLWSMVVGASAKTMDDERYLVPVGQAVGIKLFSDGVVVVGLSEVAGSTPAATCGLRQGDIITHINDTQVDTIEEVRAVLQDLEGNKMSIRAARGEREVQFTTQAVACKDGTYKLGAWIRDSMAGIGTVTFYDPVSGTFGALGHSINDIDTALVMPLESGAIMPATVSDVKKGQIGAPGELHGTFDVATDLGQLHANTTSGIFGRVSETEIFDKNEPLPVADSDEIQVGRATILSNISGNSVEEFEVEIIRLCPEGGDDPRDMMISVTDNRLLETTGGIVQGMSGSPIIQNGKLIGAVTHVLVNDPTRGYGIFMETMLETAENMA